MRAKHWLKRWSDGLFGSRIGRAASLVAAGVMAMAGAADVKAGEPCNDCGPLDVVFIVDDTGSMGTAIAEVKAGIASIINQIRCASDNDYQLGLITFDDCVQIDVQLAPGNDAAMLAAVMALTAGGGVGYAEASDAAVNAAVNSLPAALNCCQDVDFLGTWRPGATKIVIVITDAPPGGCDDVFTPGVDDVNAHQYALDALANGILISSIYVSGGVDPAAEGVLQDYATTTGGNYLYAPGGVGTDAAISAILDDCGGGCARVTDVEVKCDPTDIGVVHITMTVTNNSGTDADYLLFTPQSPSPLDVMFIPNIMPVSLPNGASTTVTVTVVDLGGLGGIGDTEICFTVTLKESPFGLCSDCCSVQVCATAECDCFEMIKSTVDCIDSSPNEFSWTFEFINHSGQDVHHVYFLTPPGGVVVDTPGPADNYLYFNPPIPNGGSSGAIKVVLRFPAGELPPHGVCVYLTLNDAMLNACCKKRTCVTLPDCHDPDPVGACCLHDGGGCITTTALDCEAIGVYFGDGVPCTAVHCPIITEPGGCCLPDGTCIPVPAASECLAMGGVYLGFGVPCGTPGFECLKYREKGACCLAEGCVNLTGFDCYAVGGYWFGPLTDCTVVVPTGNCRAACCTDRGCVIVVTPAECDERDGVYLGPGSFCADCPDSPVLGDANGNGLVDADDLSGLLSAFGATDSLYDLNWDGVVDAEDLAIMLINFGVTAGKS
jgi:uncharacterized protein YegL